MTVKVLVNDPLDASAMETLAKIPHTEIVAKHYEQAELKAVIPNYHVLVVRSATKANKEIIEAGTNLKLIARAGTGLDNVDVKTAQARNITVINTPGANAISVAELTIGLAPSLFRFIPRGTAGLKEGKWEKKALEGCELWGKTVGIIGFGAIAQEVTKRLLAFDCKILVYVTRPRTSPLNVTFVTLEELYRSSDVITIHAPLKDETKHMINEAALNKMKDGVTIIHTARGGIIDEAALLKALETGKVAGAGLDVFEVEPPTDEIRKKLLAHPNVIGTPHIGASTKEAQVRVGDQIVEKLRAEIAKLA